MAATRISYAQQDALSLLVMGRRAVGRGPGFISRPTADRLVANGYAILAPDGQLEVTPLGQTEYDHSIGRQHTTYRKQPI